MTQLQNLNDLIDKNDIEGIWNFIRPELARTHYKHNDDFEDLMSIGLIKIIEILPRANTKLPPIESKKFLLTCARNAIVDHLRKLEPHKKVPDVISFESLTLEQFPHPFFDRTNLEQLETAMTFLSTRQRKLIEMFYFNNIGLNSIASKMKYRPKDIKMLIEQALDTLRKHIRV